MAARTKALYQRDESWWEWRGNADSQPTGSPAGHHRASWYEELLYSESHYLDGLGQHDVGGKFHKIGRELKERNFKPTRNRTSSDPSNVYAYNYNGSYYAKYTTVGMAQFPLPVIASDLELDAYGATAISQVIPTNPLVGLATTLGELRSEGIPAVIGAESLRARALRARNAGSEYLNLEFGWRPLVNDVLALADAILNSQELMRQYERESGKLLHRTYTYPDIITTSSVDETDVPIIPLIKTAYMLSSGRRTTITTTRVRKWFEGVFTYHLAPQGSLARKEQLVAKRFGLRLTPELLWNLTPWTWAADWVSNIGDVIHNVSAFANDGLVMPWGYMMKETSISNEYVHSGGSLTHEATPIGTISQKLTATRKQRRKATPFGFGLDPTTFSGRQWSILVALGLAHGDGQVPHTIRHA